MAEEQGPSKDLKPIITYEEYSKLDPQTDKQYYKVRTQAADLDAMAALDTGNTAAQGLQQLKPLYEKMKLLPAKLPGETLLKLTSDLETMVSLLDPIKALMSVPIINQLVRPLVNLINKIFQVIGGIFALIIYISRGMDIFTDTYVKAIEDIDMQALTDAANAVAEKKKAYEAMKKQKEEEKKKEEEESMKKAEEALEKLKEDAAEATASGDSEEIQKSAEELKKEAEKTALKEAIKAELGDEDESGELTETIASMTNSLELGIAYARIAKAMKLALKQYAFTNGNAASAIVKILDTLGIDPSPLFQPSEKDMEKFEKMFPNPTKSIQKLNDAAKKINADTKYVLITEEYVEDKAQKEKAGEAEKSA